ncbi:MAG: hypothetical protein AAGA17_01025 [Actinomycetota bacterium]
MTWLADLRLPAATSSLRTIRLLVGSVGSTVELTVDEIEDLQMGAAECAALLMDGVADGAVLTLEVHGHDEAVEVRGSVETDHAAVEIDELALLVLRGTVDEHELHPGPGRRSFSVRKQRRG